MNLQAVRFALMALLCASLFGCTGDAAKHAARETSPLVGTWVRDGDVPAPVPNTPQFTKLTFTGDGTLAAEYVAAGGALAGIIKKSPKLQTERDTYTLIADQQVKIVEGSSSHEFRYDVHDGKLYLTPLGGGEATTFSKAVTG